jgi:hypothetical protein
MSPKLTMLIFLFRVKIVKTQKKWNSKIKNRGFTESLSKIGG